MPRLAIKLLTKANRSPIYKYKYPARIPFGYRTPYVRHPELCERGWHYIHHKVTSLPGYLYGSNYRVYIVLPLGKSDEDSYKGTCPQLLFLGRLPLRLPSYSGYWLQETFKSISDYLSAHETELLNRLRSKKIPIAIKREARKNRSAKRPF